LSAADTPLGRPSCTAKTFVPPSASVSVISVHLLPGARVKEPVKQFRTANAERILQILARPGAVTVE
jgi:hypothetical protein